MCPMCLPIEFYFDFNAVLSGEKLLVMDCLRSLVNVLCGQYTKVCFAEIYMSGFEYSL